MASKTGSATILMAILSACFLSGCIVFKSGGGPVSRSEAARIMGSDFTPATQEQKESFAELGQTKKDWLNNMPSLISSGIGNSTSIKTSQKSNQSFGKILKCGWWPSRVASMERVEKGGRSETYCREETLFVPGYPLMWPIWTDWSGTYVQSTGDQVGRSSAYGLGLGTCVAGRMKMVTPVSLDLKNGGTPEQYDVIKFWYLAAGIVGGGRVNHKYYGQLLWTAFPVGSAD
jgi:hypothetical protein